MTFSFFLDGNRKIHELEAEVELLSTGIPGNLHGHPDSRYPAEGPQVGSIAVLMRYKTKGRRLAVKLENYVLESKEFKSKLERVLEDL